MTKAQLIRQMEYRIQIMTKAMVESQDPNVASDWESRIEQAKADLGLIEQLDQE